MSSPPTDGEGSALYSSRAPPGSFSSSHGSYRDDDSSMDHDDGGAVSPGVGSGQIASPVATTERDASKFAVGASVFADFDELPQKVSELGMVDVIDSSQGRRSGGSVLSHSLSQGVTSSRAIFDQPFKGRQSGLAYAQSDSSDGLRSSPVQSVGRRSQVVSGNHLLNFHFDPISRPQPRTMPPKRQQKVRPYSKDLFLQANYKFSVLDTGDYVRGSMDPDKMLEWEDVVCVRYLTPFNVQCPICLESPMSAQITSCGHIYCFPCILQYLLMGEDNHQVDSWKRCPLCFTMISIKDLYTVYIHNVKPYNVGDHVHLTLLTRARDSSVPLQKNHQRFDSVLCGVDDLWDSFTKFTLTSDVELSVREAKKDLNDWLAKADAGLVDDLEKLPYVCAALDQLDKRMKNWAEHRTFSNSLPLTGAFPSSMPVSSPPDRTKPSASRATKTDERIHSKAPELPTRRLFPGQEGGSNGWQVDAEAHLMPPSHVQELWESPEKALAKDGTKESQKHSDSRDNNNERDSYFFYQAVDGQHLILHPLNMKCLLHHYKTYDSLPERIDGKILELETVTQSEVARRRYRFVSHFPLTTNFQLCEINLGDVLPADALSPFMDEIKKRDKQRKRLAKKEQEEKALAEAAELIARPGAFNDHGRSSRSSAAFSLDDFEALGSSMALSTSPPATGEKKSFSDVARLGFASGHDSPSLRPGDASTHSAEAAGEASTVAGQRTAAMSFAGITAAPKAAAAPVAGAPKIEGLGRKGKKPARVLLSTAGGRRY